MATLSDAKASYLKVFDDMLSSTGIVLDNLKFYNRTTNVDFETKEYRITTSKNEYVSIIDNGDASKFTRYSVVLHLNGSDYEKTIKILQTDFSTRETAFLLKYQPILDEKYNTMKNIGDNAAVRLKEIIDNQ